MVKIIDPEELQLRADPRDSRATPSRRLSVTEVCALFCGIIATLVLAGWVLHNDFLIRIVPRFPSMAASTAITFLCASAALWTLRTHEEGVVTGPASQILSFLVMIFGIGTLIGYGVDAMHHHPRLSFEAVHHHPWQPFNRMSPNVAVNFTLLGLAIGLADVHREGERWPSQAIALIVMFDGLMALTGHLYGISDLFGLMPYVGMAVHTGVMFVILTVGFLYARPERGLVGIVRSNTVAGRAARRLMPAVVTVPLILGGSTVIAIHLQHSEVSFVAYVIVVTGIGTLTWLLWGNILALNTQVEMAAAYERKVAELEREKIEDALTVTQERLSFAVAGSGIGTWHWDIASDNLVWSDTCKALFGLPASTVMTREVFYARLHPDDRENATKSIANALALKQPYDIEYRAVWPNGTVHWVAAKGRAYLGPDGQANRLEGTIQDINQRKAAEEALREATERQRIMLKDVLENVTEGKLRLCDSRSDLPAPLSQQNKPIMITRAEGLAALRRTTKEIALSLNFPADRWQGIVTAASEAGMNTVVHGGGKGTGFVSTDCDHTIQIRVEDTGSGIRVENLPKATLSRGWSSQESLGHGLVMMLQSADRMWLLTGPSGTIIVLEQDREEPPPQWFRTPEVSASEAPQ